MASRLWKFLTTDVGDLVSLETVDSSKDAVEAVLDIAEVLQSEGPKVQQLAPLVNQLGSLMDVLNSPLGDIVETSLPFVSIATGLLKFYLEKTKEGPSLVQSVALMSQAAYLESFKEFVRQQPKVQTWLTAADKRARAQDLTPEVKALGDFDLTDREARLALLHFHQSALAIAFNDALIARLVHLGAKREAADKIAARVAQNTNRHMRNAIADAEAPVQRIVEWYRIGGDADFEKYLSIDTYLAEAIALRPHEQVFAEPFTFKDIYAPLRAYPKTSAERNVMNALASCIIAR